MRGLDRFCIAIVLAVYIGLMAWQIQQGGWEWVAVDGAVITLGLWLITMKEKHV